MSVWAAGPTKRSVPQGPGPGRLASNVVIDWRGLTFDEVVVCDVSV